ncbi:NAD(P)H-hydrate dehydratase [Pseudoalteromonas sp. PS5]|uniref:NAD(P)H-hydrate dehydratase n=1 Tax=Pseudoalteromonas sp. PS5 TaxID=1437473 RepID=UPI000FFE4E7D|nr:NAD(P)H-hydrate dehydratase [Pseudoalteromonas sp. PS5]RXF03458.1 NAD(P)H-hydrate dehydratase [Pseudoalteromonas sp. PS5]
MANEYSDNLPQVAYTSQQVQQYEGQAAKLSGTNLTTLMRRAGHAAFSYVNDTMSSHEKVLVITGKGNNAGDGFIVAQLCWEAGIAVTVLTLFEPKRLAGDAQQAYRQYHGKLVSTYNEIDLSQFTTVVDAVFGTGFRGELPEHVRTCFDCINNLPIRKVALDVPSGVNATTGEVAPSALMASTTVTFIALKQGLLSGTAKRFVGNLLLAGLGVDKAFNSQVTATSNFLNHETLMATRPQRALDSYKNSHGHVLVIGGNHGMAGAVRLAAEAALRAGAGLVSVATHPDNTAAVLYGRYELMVHAVATAEALLPLLNKASVVVLGPGLGQDLWAQSLFRKVIQTKLPLVLDADGLNLLAKEPVARSNWVLTPHLGEARRLLKNVNAKVDEADRFAVVSNISKQYQATTVLKGPGSLVAQQQSININRSGCAAMASAGMGDVLSGIIGGLLAQGMEAFAATNLAVYIHGLAAEQAADDGAKGMLAGDLFEHIRGILG